MEYIPRLLDGHLAGLLQETPAVLVVGPRGSGKTTTCRRFASTTLRMDRRADAAAVEADPDAALRGLAEPVLVDEWQVVPHVLGAIKRTVDDDPRPGRFLVTGSVHADLEAETWPGTGRLLRTVLSGLCGRERLGDARQRSLIDRLAAGPNTLRVPASPPDLRGYVEQMIVGGMPAAVTAADERAARRWTTGYVDQLVTRDAELAGERRDPDRLRRFVDALASQTGRTVDASTLYAAADVNSKTGRAYEQLLRNLFLVDRLAAWHSNRLKRLARRPKRVFVDTGLAAGALRIGSDDLMRGGDLIGQMLETFVLAQLRAEVEAADAWARLYHVREREGRHEVDVLIDLGGGRVFGIEVKASASPSLRDARHLAWLRDRAGPEFVGGLVLHTGPRMFELSDRVVAAPVCALWG